MPKTGKFIHTITHAVSLAASNTYATARRHNLDLQSDYTGNSAPRLNVKLGTLNLHVNTIAGGATSITVRLTYDAAGDDIAFGDTTATISTGVTTATQGSVTYKIDSLYGHVDDNLYCFWKTDAGTATVDKIVINYEE